MSMSWKRILSLGFIMTATGGLLLAACAPDGGEMLPDERATLAAALEDAGGNRARAAEMLGMGRTTLWRKMRQYGLATE